MSEKATFAAGCFWSIEARFRKLHGVVDAQVGYTGGEKENPTYEEVCSGKTGHAEAVEVTYNPEEISYETLLAEFWNIHNPTQAGGQGLNIGENYRSAIFFHTPEQKTAAEKSRDDLQRSGILQERNIVTEITQATTFWPAEDYHQRYMEKHGGMRC